MEIYKYMISLWSSKDNIHFEIKSSNKNEIEDYVRDLLLVFSVPNFERKKNILNVFQIKTDYQSEILDSVLEKYENRFPVIKSLKSFLNKIPINEYFFINPNLDLNTYEKLSIILKLENLNGKISLISKEDLHEYKFFLNKYSTTSYGKSIIYIGETNKNKRVCRFCKNKKELISFKGKAHAISEGLGNKTIILNEECDTCNEIFSKTIEPDIIHYLSLFRTFFDVKGKRKKGRGSSKKLYSKNKDLKLETENNHFTFNIYDENILSLDEDSLPSKIRLELPQKIIKQNIYKSLCKYFLSVINKDKLPFFDETIKWINGEREIEQLPLIAELLTYQSFSTQPKIITHIREDNDKYVPFAVGEFHFTCFIFVFVIPFSSKDDKDFILKEEFEGFWKTFKHYNKRRNWQFKNFSKNSSVEYIMDIKIEKNQ